MPKALFRKLCVFHIFVIYPINSRVVNLKKYIRFLSSMFYDDRLLERISGNNEGVVMNNNFATWHIIDNLENRSSERNKRYQHSPDKELFKICYEHSKDYEKDIDKNNIVLVHPFHLTHMYRLENENTRFEADKYLDTLLSLLYAKKCGIVAMETLHHYAACTSLFMEQGFIDKIIFTEYDKGVPLNDELEELKGDIFVGGGYNTLCLSSVVRAMRKHTEDIWAIRELVLESPAFCKVSLEPTSVYGLHRNRMLRLDEVLERCSDG